MAALATGCAGTYGATVTDDGYGPDLVYASPGVQVIADYDEPIFYSDGLYWRYYGGTWYRSPRYTSGWVVAAPPPAIRRIDHPHAFVHYRPQGWASHRRYVAPGPRVDRQRWGRPEQRRMDARPAAPAFRAPTVRGAPPRGMNRGGPPPGNGFGNGRGRRR